MKNNHYLDSSFDYTKLTKMELRDIMSANNIEEIPPLSAKKDVILQAYKTNIHDRIEILKRGENFSRKNIFQSEESSFVNNKIISDNVSISYDNNSFISDDNLYSSKSISKELESNISKELESNISKDFGKSVRIGNKIFEVVDKKESSDFSSFEDFEDNIEEGNSVEKYNNVEKDNSVVKDNDLVQKNVFDKKHQFELIEAPRVQSKKVKKENFKNSSKISSKFKTGKIIFCLFFIFIVIYLKFYAPYCSSDSMWCIPLPKNSHLVKNKLICNPGFTKKNSIIDHCKKIDKSNLIKEVNKIIRKLEYYSGEYSYKARNSPEILISSLTKNNEIIQLLKSNQNCIINGNRISSVKSRVSFSVLLRFYGVLLTKIGTSLIFTYFLLLFFIRRYKRNKIYKAEAVEIARDVFEILSRQLLMALRTNQIRPYVYTDQIQAVLKVDSSVWYYVKNIVENSCNIEVLPDEQNRVQWKWVGPILLNKGNEDSFLKNE